MAVFRNWTLPMPVVAPTDGSAVSASAILNASFGGLASQWQNHWVAYYGPAFLAQNILSYWDTASPSVARWRLDGVAIGEDFASQTYVSAANLGRLSIMPGNDIGPLAYLTTNQAGTSGAYTVYAQYSAVVVEQEVLGANAGKGQPTAADIVAAAYRYAARYGEPLNANDCHFISASVAAAAGAVFTDATQSLDPTQNEEYGFWRIAYRGSDAGAVGAWQSRVEAGDIVRMGWNGGGFHTITVLAVHDDGTLTVYDNTKSGPNGSVIGVHRTNFDTRTIASTITVYRLSDDKLFLMKGLDGYGETITGSVFNDHILGMSGDDTLRGGLGGDTLDGGLGADRLEGGVGNDTYWIDNAGDVVVELAGQGTDRVNTTISFDARGLSVENLAVVGAGRANLVGNELDNVMVGNESVNALNGGLGADRMVGGGGNDLYYVDNVGDAVVEAAAGGTDTVRAVINYTLGANVEKLELIGTRQLNAVGNALDNTLVGNARPNIIIGMGGRDLMTGGAGNDRFDFRAVSDSPFAAYDRITDLEDGDVINLSAIDARTNVAGDQAFVIVAAFTGVSGQMTRTYNATGDFTILTMDVNGDRIGDMRILLDGDQRDYDDFRL